MTTGAVPAGDPGIVAGSLAGCTVVVTGAGRGLGAGIATAVAAAGANVVVGHSASADQAAAVADACRGYGVGAVCVAGDVRDAATHERLRDAALALGDRLDGWVNNAGVSRLAPFLATSVDDLRVQLDVNLIGTWHGAHCAATHMAAHGGGRIVNVASELGRVGAPLLSAYCASKFAVVGLTQTMALELAGSAICVNALCPGTAATEMNLAEWHAQAAHTGDHVDDVRAAYLAGIPAGRFIEPHDVGAAAVWLLSPAASYITGQSICVTGGSYLG